MRLQFVEAGEIVSTHGIKGEMKVLPWVDGPEILCEFDRCRICGKEYEIEECRVQKTCNLLVFSSYWAIDFICRRNPGLKLREIVVEEG